jgi:drug/metabolite transporter (DMT)-like permease
MDDNVPPVYSTPPPLIPASRPRQRPQGRGWVWLIVALVGVFVVVLFVLAGLTHLLGSGVHMGTKTVRQSGHSLCLI